MKRILIVEDEMEIAQLEKDYLEINGYAVDIIDNGFDAAKAAIDGEYDLVLLDLMLPGRSGYEICKEIREHKEIPVLMVTARTESIDKIRGLGLGADDYILKPFDPSELVARVKAHLSRYERLTKLAGGKTDDQKDRIEVGELKIYRKSWRVFRAGKEVILPNKEFELLLFLSEHPNIVFSKDQLFEAVWGYDYTGDSATVTVHINRIRDKIEADSENPQYIKTIWGAGYRFTI